MSKETINVKSNGLRNELKEIRKSIDKLTNVFHHVIDIWSKGGFEQTNKQHEHDNFKPYWEYRPDRMWYTTDSTSTTDVKNDEEV